MPVVSEAQAYGRIAMKERTTHQKQQVIARLRDGVDKKVRR
jgi:hypothetical protein